MRKLQNLFNSEPPRFSGTTVIEIAVPSGKLIASDDLRGPKYFCVESTRSINYGAGLDAYTRQIAEQTQTAYAFVGNSCPAITRQNDGSLVVVEHGFDDETEMPVMVNDETIVARICTDHWATMLTDYDHWLSHGGDPVTEDGDDFSLIEVTPGLYRWTVYSNDDAFSMQSLGRIEYARLELIQAY